MNAYLISVSTPRWANQEHTAIDCEITTSQFGTESLPFTASQNDIEAHGRAIFFDLVAGVYGPVADYVPPPVVPAPPIEVIKNNE